MRVLDLLKRKGSGTQSVSEVPWFDKPDARDLLEGRRRLERLSDEDYALLKKWMTDGYCAVSGLIPEEQIDAMARDMDQIWTAGRPIKGLQILDLLLEPQTPLRNLSHAELLAIEPEERFKVREASHWRVHGFYLFSQHARKIFENRELIRLASLILGCPAEPTFTINFTYGSEQALHQDTAVFHVEPRNYLVGAWLACEDISPEAGPLVFYPGSQREPLFPKFDNYPQTNLRTAQNTQEYSDYVAQCSQRYERKLYDARKGDIFLWHGMLIHGGSEVSDKHKTRRSYVCHYIPPGMDVSAKVKGPFNW
ncbi:MAG: phytanoyl-CoA dioxygenase family protein [Pyrinomonadaceae bacterium]